MFGIWVFDIPPPPFLSELLARYSDCGTLYVCSCCWPVQGQRFFEASCCHDTNLLLRASSRAMARYTADSGITIKKSEQERQRERQGWRGSDGELGDIMSIYAETHVQDLLTFFGQQILDGALVCKELQATPLTEQPCSNLV